MRFSLIRWVGVLAVAIGMFATIAVAQPSQPAPYDPLEAAKQQQKIAEQRVAVDIRNALENADRLAKGQLTAKAIQGLKNMKANVQVIIGISDAARTRFTAMLDAKIAAIEGRAIANANPNPGVLLDPKGPVVRAEKKEAWEKYFAELKDVRDGIKKVEQAQVAGKNYEANAEVARLAKTYPYNPSVVALSQNGTMQNNIADAQAHFAAMSQRWVANQKNINKSSLPAITDVEFPENWKQLSEARLKALRPKVSEKERKIVEALDKPTTVNFNERPLEEALQDLSTAFDVPFYLEKKSLEDLGLDLKKGVSMQGKGLSGRTILRSILATQGLTFVVKDEAIQIVTVERAQSLLSTRVYYIGDLINAGLFSGPEWGPVLNAMQSADNAKVIVDMITKSIEPLMWKQNGGPGTVTFHYPSMSLIVRASTEVHFKLSQGLGR